MQRKGFELQNLLQYMIIAKTFNSTLLIGYNLMKLGKKKIGIALLLLFMTNIFSIKGYDSPIYKNAIITILALLALYTFLCLGKIKNEHIRLRKFVWGLILIPFLGFIPAYILHGQGIGMSIISAHIHVGYFIFFFLFLTKIKEQEVLKIFCLFGVCWSAIEIIQQFTYPTYWFATRYETDDRGIEIRNGIYRFAVYGVNFGLILLFYCFEKFMQIKRKSYLVGMLIALIGIYLLATRQTIVMSVVCLFAGLFIMKKISVGSLVLLGIFSTIIYLNADSLFGDFIEMTKEVDEDYIRFLAYEFYGITYNKGSVLAFLLGNGTPKSPSEYFQEITNYQEYYGLYRDDVGLIGIYSLYGIVYVIMIIWFYWYAFRNRKYLSPYLQMYVLYMAGTSVMLLHFGAHLPTIVTGSFILYLIEKNIERNKFTKTNQYEIQRNNPRL